MVEIRDGLDVSIMSNIFQESSWVGLFTILTSPNSPTISISLLCFAAVCWFVAQTFSLSMAGRFRSPARMTDIYRYRMERDSCKASRDVSQVVFSLSWGSAIMSFWSAIKTPPPWML